MKKLILSGVVAMLLSIFAIAETHAQSVTFEIRNCTDIGLCTTINGFFPSPGTCNNSNSYNVCFSPTIPAGTVANITVSDINCSYLTVRNPAGSGLITNISPSGPFGDYCACWDFTGANPVLTIYEGDCVTPCPAPDCP